MAAVSPNLCAVVTRELKLDREPLCIPNMLAPEFLAPLNAAKTSAKEFVFLTVGNFIPVKGHAFLLKAFARAFAGTPDVKLRIGGDGDLDESLRRLAVDLGIADRVTFPGRLSPEAVAAQMDSCNAFVLPSIVETFGVVVIEALARGKPVIATNCGGPESILTPADGVLVPPGDVGSLESALKSMSDDADDYGPEDLRSRALARFGPAVIARKLTDIYAGVLSGA
jgi:glycosyltransferase involved in cell wall biosynthesis